MKKLLVAVLVFAMVLSLAATLSSCKKDEEEPSKEVSAEESKPEESKPEESKPEVSEPEVSEPEVSEPEVSEPEVSEPEVSEEPSEEPSQAEEPPVEPSQAEPPVEPSQAEPPSEAPPSVAKTSPAGTNYAPNATYTLTKNGEYEPTLVYLSYDKGKYDYADIDPDNPEHQFYKLNDGVVGDIAAYEGTGEGYYSDAASLVGTTVQYVGTDAAFEFLFDLGDCYGDIKSLVFRNVRHGTPNGNNRGFEVKLVQASDDGVAWHRVKGELTSVQIAGAPEIESMMEEGAKNVEHFDFTYTFDEPVQAKNLKVILSDDGGYVLQLEEIEIRN